MKNLAIFILAISVFTFLGKAYTHEIPSCEKGLQAEKIEPPKYPTSPQRPSEMNGTVLLQFIVNESGAVSDSLVVESSHKRFNRSAQKAILQAKFPPQKVKCTHQYRYTYVVE